MAEPLQSQRNLIFDQVLVLLKEISVDRGDATSPVGVQEGLLDEEDVTQWPWLCLTEALRSTVGLIEAEGGGGAIGYQHGYGLSVYGYVKETEGRTRRQWLEDLWEDVKRKLLTNSRLVATGVELCQAILVSGDRETDGGASHPRGVFVQDFVIVYTEGMSG